jgi:hypothetical protein
MNSLYIDKIKSDPKIFVYPSMSLSSSRDNMNGHTFELNLAKIDLLQGFLGVYKEWVVESKINDLIRGWPDSDDVIGVAGYPDLEQILDDENMAEMLFGCYLVEEVFCKYCCSNYEMVEYWCDKINGVTVTDCDIKIYGICYSKRKS